MIELILKSYFNILFLVGASCFALFSLGTYFIFKFNKRDAKARLKSVAADEASTSADDMIAIAGDDLFATQLDLARAFIESGKKQFAKKILQNILMDGSPLQKQEAKLLLGQC